MNLVRNVEFVTLPPPLPRTSTTRFFIFLRRISLKEVLKKDFSFRLRLNEPRSINAIVFSESTLRFLVASIICFFLSVRLVLANRDIAIRLRVSVRGLYGGSTAWLIPDLTLPETGIRFRLPLFRLVIDKKHSERRTWSTAGSNCSAHNRGYPSGCRL